MLNLQDKIWKDLAGGYKIPYDVSIPLKKLESSTNAGERKGIFRELWQELHHQGDVGLASYLAVPQLVRIAIAKDLFDPNILSLCTIIEQQRHLGNNPALPEEFNDHYNDGLIKLKQFVIQNLNRKMDDDTYRISLSALAVCEGKIKISKAISELDNDVLDEFLQQF